MTLTKQKTAVIAGGGLAGLAAAVYLDELGYQITLIEKKQILGGRTYSFIDKKTGLTIDNGQHLLIGAYHHTLDFLQRIGAKSKIQVMIPTRVPLLDDKGKISYFDLKDHKPPLHLARALIGYKGLSLSDKFRLIKLGLELKKYLKGKKQIPKDLTVLEWLKSLKQSDRSIENFWEILTLATLNDSAKNTTADGLITVLLKSYFGEKNDGFLIFPKVGLSELFVDPTEAYLSLRNQQVIRGISLKSVRILDNQVQNFEFSDGSIVKADLFVSALPFRPLLNTLPEPFVENHPELQHAKEMKSAPIVSINLVFDRPVLDESFIGSASIRTHWFFSKDHIFTGLPQDKCHVMGVISGAYDLLDHSKEQIVELALNDLKQISKKARDAKLIHSLVNKEREATISCRKGVNAQRPKQKMLNNFYCVGDWTQTGLPGTIESAILSSKLMAEELAS